MIRLYYVGKFGIKYGILYIIIGYWIIIGDVDSIINLIYDIIDLDI